jgi:broad specificity phosphatase PhoE
MDMPLSENGIRQVERLTEALALQAVETIYSAPCESALATANAIAGGNRSDERRIRVVEEFQNVDHGLWHGKLIAELRRQLPKVFRTGQESAEAVCPPEGETFEAARVRAEKALGRILRKERDRTTVLVIPDPLASIVHSVVSGEPLDDLWEAECDSGRWEELPVAVAPSWMFNPFRSRGSRPWSLVRESTPEFA